MYTEIVKQIHNEFDLSVNTLLEFAELNESKADKIKIKKKELKNKEILQNFGFNNTKNVKEVTDKLNKKSAFENKSSIKDVIQKYQRILPGYKFITLSQVYEICDKYDLYIGNASLFEGEIPQNNIDDISRFPSHKMKTEIVIAGSYYYIYQDAKPNGYLTTSSSIPTFYSDSGYNLQFSICAPESDFQKGTTKIGREIFKDENLKSKFKLEKRVKVEDPIVLCPCERLKNDDILFAIVTAWGPEAQDSNVFNEIAN
jgi:hypothetical protein